jgi:hypothetical protein
MVLHRKEDILSAAKKSLAGSEILIEGNPAVLPK